MACPLRYQRAALRAAMEAGYSFTVFNLFFVTRHEVHSITHTPCITQVEKKQTKLNVLQALQPVESQDYRHFLQLR